MGITNNFVYALVYMFETLIPGGLTGSFIFGLWLWFSGCFLGVNSNEGFSSLGNPHFKNFLRIHISPEGDVAIYPVGIKNTVSTWKQEGEGENLMFSSADSVQYYLIEPPIIIKNQKQ